MGHPKPGYSPYGSSPELQSSMTSTLCNQMQLNQLSPLQSLAPPRQFPFYGDVYQGHGAGMGHGAFLSDLTSMQSIPRYDTDVNPAFLAENGSQNPGE